MEPEPQDEADVFKPFEPTGEVQDDGGKDLMDDFEEFDPFQVGASSDDQQNVKEDQGERGDISEDAASKGTSALPPRMDVRFKVHEEISSRAYVDTENEGSSSISVEGTVLVSLVAIEGFNQGTGLIY